MVYALEHKYALTVALLVLIGTPIMISLEAKAESQPSANPGGARQARYVPEPRPVTSDYLIGAHYFPGWKQGTHWGWQKIEPYPERKPLLGYYDEGNPQVADWEIKWALEHGIKYFVYCWYRKGLGQPVNDKTLYLGHAIHEGLFNARYADRFKFAIMWTNHTGGLRVASTEDVIKNLMPFWITNYFKHPRYLKIDNKPVLFVYGLNLLLSDLGGQEGVRKTLDRMRGVCRKVGFDGLILLNEYRGKDPGGLHMTKTCGFDYVFPYCWHTPIKRPIAEQAITFQLEHVKAWQDAGILPYLNTASVGWDPFPWRVNDPKSWRHADKISRWKLPPQQYRILLTKVKSQMDKMSTESLGRRMIVLDNWNEWGEGHYIAPHAQAGFGYLKAVREVFTKADNKPDYRLPKELGFGPYDTLYQQYKAKQEQAKIGVPTEK
ncbi:MAG: glycoside hydrolase family 99-like domain-containing protein [Planctomycetota bacterium]|jgi:hypothetical protein